MRCFATAVVLVACLAVAARAAAPLYEMPPPKPWPATFDSTTEEVVPGLEPTDGFAINATTPNLEPLAPLLATIRPIGPIVYSLQRALNLTERHPTLPGHDLQNKTSLTILTPSAEAMLKLPFQLSAAGLLEDRDRELLLTVPLLKAAADSRRLALMSQQVAHNMALKRMVPYAYLNNATRLTTRLGFPVSVMVSPDGRDKYFVSGNCTAKIVKPDHGGRPMIPAVAYVVDSFLLPLEWKL
ncbi:hypothetical protein Rsub_10907 [Raphidocelis subcapitata]|uniref:Uncharacterized protein n=1 Tax=Raphidocelis subcapitata TaxID=307507 RepID=A0A2V0PIH4_9CHLO|nr:hypothetical protein Rsub_10907 [Raphidocelis subcapitata]|eukprot:GBF97743.1 hypothetical protein Rsub_10907 [Raphidocelis subcapitata]